MSCPISLIIPVYNVQDHIEQFMQSLSCQTMRPQEVLIINDGSTDGSMEICERYAKNDCSIKIISQENRGLAAARNAGVRAASAEYIMFADPDDILEPDFIWAAYSAAKENDADMVLFEYIKIGGKTSEISTVQEGLCSKEQALQLLFECCGDYAWNKLYRAALFEGIEYPEGRLYEDIATTYRLIEKAERFFYLKKRLYRYCYRAGSLSTSRSRGAYTDFLEITFLQAEYFAAQGATCYSQALKRAAVAALGYILNIGYRM